MRLVAQKDELAAALAAAGRAASAKSTIQILSHILLRAEDGRCELAATDMEVSLRVPLAATVAVGRHPRYRTVFPEGEGGELLVEDSA